MLVVKVISAVPSKAARNENRPLAKYQEPAKTRARCGRASRVRADSLRA